MKCDALRFGLANGRWDGLTVLTVIEDALFKMRFEFVSNPDGSPKEITRYPWPSNSEARQYLDEQDYTDLMFLVWEIYDPEKSLVSNPFHNLLQNVGVLTEYTQKTPPAILEDPHKAAFFSKQSAQRNQAEADASLPLFDEGEEAQPRKEDAAAPWHWQQIGEVARGNMERLFNKER